MIDVTLEKNNFAPGEKIRGKLAWKSRRGGEQFEIRLLWFTEGKGTRDHSVVQEKPVELKGAEGTFDFSFTAPQWPNSFSGQFISLRWAVEAVELSSEEATRADLVIGPEGSETILPSLSR